jgi:hypothetical protein
MLLILGVGLAIGPLVAALLMGIFGPVALFVITVAFHGALAAAAFLRMRIRQALDATEREPFRPIAAEKGAPESVALDPRAHGNDHPDVGFEEDDEGNVQVRA